MAVGSGRAAAAAASSRGTFATGNYPVGLAFDGANVWVTNADDGTLMKR